MTSAGQPRPVVAVFGSSEPTPGEPSYILAQTTGRLLAGRGYSVVTGGYGGVMEAASRGAFEAGGHTIGVTCAIFESRQPNAFLREVHSTDDLHDRTRELIRRARGFVVLPGKAGTLAELALLWALDRAGCLDRRPVVLLGDPYRAMLELLERTKLLDREQLDHTRIAETPEQALELLGPTATDDHA